jgi:pimeloyl-ACP methyl ester carboxylesterase
MAEQKSDLVILIHGIHGYADMHLGVPMDGLESMEGWLKKAGYIVKIFHYTPFKKSIEDLAVELVVFIDQQIEEDYNKLYIIGHSLGGLIAHEYLMTTKPRGFDKAIYLSSPFGGSQNADFYQKYLKDLFALTSGDAGYQLTREYRENNPLKKPDYPVGVITGDDAGPLYFWNRGIMNPKRDGKDDGLVPVSSAMALKTDHFCLLETTHNLILYSKEARAQILYFFQNGEFDQSLEDCRFPKAQASE